MRRAARKDRNHNEIASAYESVGCSVFDTSQLGNGFPDMMVGRNGKNLLVEVKDGSKSPSRQALTKAQQVWHWTWRGKVVVVRNVEEALEAAEEYL